jgi:hypothetical protein
MNIDDTWGGLGPDCTGPAGYYDEMLCVAGHWAIHSLGPNRVYGPSGDPQTMAECGYPAWPYAYDPTNGTVSDGNIMRSNKKADHK